MFSSRNVGSIWENTPVGNRPVSPANKLRRTVSLGSKSSAALFLWPLLVSTNGKSLMYSRKTWFWLMKMNIRWSIHDIIKSVSVSLYTELFRMSGNKYWMNTSAGVMQLIFIVLRSLGVLSSGVEIILSPLESLKLLGRLKDRDTAFRVSPLTWTAVHVPPRVSNKGNWSSIFLSSAEIMSGRRQKKERNSARSFGLRFFMMYCTTVGLQWRTTFRTPAGTAAAT